MMTTAQPLCWRCKHNTTKLDVPGAGNTCKAYPAGIPARIMTSRDIHTAPLPGDQGIQFEDMGRSIWDKPPAT